MGQDSRTALHETCRSQSDAEQDLHDIAKLLTDAGADLDSKAVDAGEVCYLLSVCLKVDHCALYKLFLYRVAQKNVPNFAYYNCAYISWREISFLVFVD